MKRTSYHPSDSFLKATILAAVLAIATIGVTPSADAALQGSAGNTIIRNKVTVAYKNADNVDQTPQTASIDVTVNTVAVAPTVVAFSPSPGATDGTGDTQAYSVTIRTNSNGPGTITLSATDGSATNITLSGTLPTITASLFLGSTIIDPSDAKIGVAQNVANGGSITFAAPNDGGVSLDTAATGGATGDAVLNGLKSGDTVYLTDGTNFYGPFTVGTVVDPAVGTGTTAAPGSIPLTNTSGGALAFTPGAGWMIVEAKPATLTVTQGVIGNTALAASWVTTVTGDMGGNTSTGTVTTNASVATLSVTKEVSTNGTAWAATANAAPTATLYYRITVTNNGLGAANNVVITDPTPTYTTYVSGSAKRATGAAVNYAAAPTTLSDTVAAADGYDYNETTTNTATYNVGTLSPGAANAVQLFFRVTIN